MLACVYRLILFLYPRQYRRDHGREMEASFLYCVAAEERRRTRLSRPLIWVRGLGDAVALAAAVRRDARRQHWALTQAAPCSRRHLVKIQDIRAALRLMRARPLFAAGNVLMLALGLGATTAIFSVVNGVLLKPLAFPEPDRLVEIWESVPARAIDRASLTEGYCWDVAKAARTLAEFGCLHSASFTLTGDSAPQRLNAAIVAAGFLRALGVQPIAGRLFEVADERPGAAGDVAMLGHALWQTRFSGDRSVVGRTISLDGRPYQVVGVLPPASPWLMTTDVFVPFVERAAPNRGSWEYAAVGRLKPGVTAGAAAADFDRIARELEAQFPANNKGIRIAFASSSEWVASDDLRRMLWILLGAVLLLLVIACVNVTNLQLAHAATRARETAVRTALGAGRWDLIRERLSESLMLSVVGAVLGIPVAAGMLQAFKALDPGGVPRLAAVSIDGWMLAFAMAAAIVVGVGTGLVPAWRAPAAGVLPGLRRGQRGSIGDRHNDRLRNFFVGAEVALSLMLLVGAGLLVKSLTAVMAVDRGFQTEHRLLATVSMPGAYPESRRAQIGTEILTQMEHTPGIVAVAAVSGLPVTGGSTGLGIVAADHDNLPEASVPWSTWRIVTKDYFRTMGLTLVAGRSFTEQDVIMSRPYRVIISQRLATRLWPGENPIGKTAILWKGQGNMPGEVIGVVSDMRERGLERDPTLATYFPAYGAMGATTLRLVIQTTGRPEDAAPALRRVVAGIDPTLPVSGVRTLEDIVSSSVATRRFTMSLLVVFASVALILALAGVYGVLAYTVARRTPEIGVRLALGAAPGRVLTHTFGRGLRPVAIGLAAGLGGAFWLSRLMTSLLYQVQPGDPSTYAIVTVALLAIAGVACYLPARRVLRVDPVVALRAE